MLSSITHRKPIVYLLAFSLLVAGVLQSTTRPSHARRATSTAKSTPKTGAVDEATKARVSKAYNQLPLRFEENRGQVGKEVKYLSRSSASTLFLTKTEAVLTLHAPSVSVVRMKLQGANRLPVVTGEHEMSARTNYFIGNDPQQWHGDVAQYERVRYASVYPGIDLLYYGQQQSLEYDFEVAPGADPRRIVLGFKGVRGLKIESSSGDLLLETASGEVRQHRPVVYQEVDGERRAVECRYVMKGKRKVGFKVGAYDRTQRLVIDPVLAYSTYLGGGGGSDYGYGIAVDAVGNAYVTGYTYSINFPTLNQYQTYQGDGAGNVFVTKLNTNLSGTASLLYSTYLGGNMGDFGRGIAVDSSGNVYVTGNTSSTNFPLLNQYQTYQGGLFGDAFVTKLNPNLSGTASLVYSTYLGSSGNDEGRGIAVDSSGNA
ncbi:MAG: SBBP repeat-containing protein, partial [Acidobacteria bacterium]|nr:SBBP repeat-containing protein [Acidobacteriota bacterium]